MGDKFVGETSECLLSGSVRRLIVRKLSVYLRTRCELECRNNLSVIPQFCILQVHIVVLV